MIRTTVLSTMALTILALPSRAADLPSDLAAVPPSAAGFAHIKVAELWKSDLFKEFRAAVLQAGPQALKAFDERFVPAPSTISRLTVIMLPPDRGQRQPPLVGVVACSEPFDRAKMLKSILPNGKEQKVGATTIIVDEEMELAVRIIDERTFAIAPSGIMTEYLQLKAGGENPFAAALKDAAGKAHLVIAANANLLPGEAVAELPEPIQPLARAKLAQLSVTVGSEIRADVRLHFGDESQAKSGERAAKDGIKMAREALAKLKVDFEKQLMGAGKTSVSPITELPEAALAVAALGGIARLDEVLKDLPLKREGEALAVSVEVPAAPFAAAIGMSSVSAGFALPAVAKVRMAAQRTKSSNNLRQIMLAFHNYHDTYGAFPAAAICDKDGKPLLSWRVAILPFIEQNELYKQFHLDEPWDSEHNKQLIPRMPKIYLAPNTDKPGEPVTHYRVFYGNGAALELKRGVRLAEFADGTSNTAVVFEAADPVTWTKPDDFEYKPEKPLPKLGKATAEGFNIALADGSVRFVSKKISEQTLRAIITRNGGEIIGNDFE